MNSGRGWFAAGGRSTKFGLAQYGHVSVRTPANARLAPQCPHANVAACVALPTNCLAGADLAVAGGTERVSYVNSTGGAVNVLIVVDSYYGPATSEGNITFDLTTTVQ